MVTTQIQDVTTQAHEARERSNQTQQDLQQAKCEAANLQWMMNAATKDVGHLTVQLEKEKQAVADHEVSLQACRVMHVLPGTLTKYRQRDRVGCFSDACKPCPVIDVSSSQPSPWHCAL